MSFLNPALALAGLACIAIPIIIHFLMRRRRRPIMWGAMRFLLEAYRKHRRRLRLEQLLLLAARCGVVALIALALGRPLVGAAGLLTGQGANTVYLLIDNSLTSQARGENDEPALERHKRAAAEVIAGLDPTRGDRVGLIALGGPAEAVVVPASADTAAVAQVIQSLAPTESAADLAGASRVLRDAIGDGDEAAGRTLAVVLGDFLEGAADLESALVPLGGGDGSPRRVAVLASRPAQDGATNVTITGVEPLRAVMLAGSPVPGAAAANETSAQNQVRVFLRRSGPGVREAAATKVRVRIVGDRPGGPSPQAEATVRWTAGQEEATAAVNIGAPAAGGMGVLVAEIDRDAVAGDNLFRRPVEVRDVLRVGLIAPRQVGGEGGLNPNRSADWLRLALAPTVIDRERWMARESSGEIEIAGIEPAAVDGARLAGLDVAIVATPEMLTPDGWRRLRLMADSGGVVMVLPPADATVHLWADAMIRELGLDWTIGREARVYGEGDADRGVLTPVRAAGPGRDLLELVAPELPGLIEPIHVWRALPVEAPADSAETVLALKDGSPFILAGGPGSRGTADGESPNGEPRAGGRGLVIFFASALSMEWTDLAGKPLFVPLVQELVRQGVGRARAAWTEVAGSRPEAPPRAAELRPASSEVADRQGSVAVDESGRAAEPMRRAGLFRAVDERGVARGLLAVNADPAAGRTGAQLPEAIAAWLGGLAGGGAGDAVRWLDAGLPGAGAPGQSATVSAVLAERPDDARSSLPLLVAALVLACVELAMARWFSHAHVSEQGPLAAGARGALA